MTQASTGVAGNRFVRVEGRTLRVRIQGSGTPLLLINGLTRPLESWGPFIRALPGHTFVSVDLPGVGRSPTPLLPLTIETMAGLADGLLGQLDLASADVLGFSYGGAVAQQLAYAAPGRVRRLVLVSTSCGLGATPGTQHVLREVGPSWGPASWPRPDPRGTLWHSMAIATWSGIPLLGAIDAPTLVVCGSRDQVAPPANSRLLARRIPDAELVILPAAHDLQKDAAARSLARAVEPFLAGTA